jgi:integrase
MRDVRGHNEGSIYPRADGRWVAAISLGDGRRATRYAKSRAEAKVRLAELQRLKESQAVEGSRLTLSQFLVRWLDDVRPRLAPATWKKHESICRVHLVPVVGHRRLSELSVHDVTRLVDERGPLGVLDAQTRRHVRGTMRRALADALRQGHVTKNVAALAEPPSLPHRERSVLDALQVRALIDGTREDRLHALWVLLATTGLREAEALGLTWDDVDLDGQTASVRRTLQRHDGEWQLRPPKTARSRRTVYLPSLTVEALRSHRRDQQAALMAAGKPGQLGLVFVTERGRPIHGPNLSKVLYAHLDRLGLPRVTVHDLRHSAATVLYAEGVPLEAIADMLGHSTTRVTADLYRHRVERIQRDAADAMQRAIS